MQILTNLQLGQITLPLLKMFYSNAILRLNTQHDLYPH